MFAISRIIQNEEDIPSHVDLRPSRSPRLTIHRPRSSTPVKSRRIHAHRIRCHANPPAITLANRGSVSGILGTSRCRVSLLVGEREWAIGESPGGGKYRGAADQSRGGPSLWALVGSLSVPLLESDHERCPRFPQRLPPPPLPLPPTSHLLSMPLCRNTRTKQRTTFSPIPSPPSYNPVTPPPPFCLSFKT
jgi:hypothetical protein